MPEDAVSGPRPGIRTTVVWLPDWPLVAAGIDPDQPAATFKANRVVACTAAARSAGVGRHQRRREAQARCPSLLVLDDDPDGDARAFTPVLFALENLTPRIELTRPGQCAFASRGPARYFGGDDAVAARAAELTIEALRRTGLQRTGVQVCNPGVSPLHPSSHRVAVGVADGPFAAAHAARSALRRGRISFVVAPGQTAEFLAPMSLRSLDRPDLTDVLDRLGLATLGQLAELPAADVLARFGAEGLAAHRLASGGDADVLDAADPPADLGRTVELDDPATEVSAVAFVARGLADELHDALRARGSACTRVLIGAETEAGERCERVWRQDGLALSPGAMVDRIRWQVDGWLKAGPGVRPSAGVVRIWVQPEDLIAADGRQLGFWGGDAAAAAQAARSVARLSGLLGPTSVTVAEYRGGRDHDQQIELVPAGAVDLAAERPAARSDRIAEPWPGRLPDPAPATVWGPGTVDAEVIDDYGSVVGVDGRGEVTATPARMRVGAGPSRPIVAWAGPWPVDERWWDPLSHSRRARFQVLTDDGVARLLTLENQRWSISAEYD